VFINRVGKSVTAVDFSVPWRSTKFELQFGSNGLKGLFIHMELVQPRRSDLAGPVGNDSIAPEYGFTRSQYDRLALVYVIASLRKGEWLIPAYHAVLDMEKAGRHDDPQNFSLEQWSESLAGLLRRLGFDKSMAPPY
jgi:hypothetical protein